MKRTQQLSKIVLFLLIQFTILGCDSTQDRANNFVLKYNRSASSSLSFYGNNIIQRTYAELESGENKVQKNIKIVFVSNFSYTDPEKDIYKSFIPIAFASFIKEDKEAFYLVNHGVSFRVIFSSRTDRPMSELIIDKAKLDELLKEKANPPGTLPSTAPGNNLSPQLNQILNLLNKSLPIVIDKEMDAKIVKISVNEKAELVYSVEVGDDEIAGMLKSDEAEALIKENILRNPQVRSLFTKMRTMGISNLRYIYHDKKGKELNQILISPKDMQAPQ